MGNRRTFFQGYAQDEFKVTPNLTLNLGLRYEYYSVAHEILNRSVIQQQLGHDFVGQVSYIGGQGHHLFSSYTVNRIDPATGQRPLAGFGSFGLQSNDGNNNFNTLQGSLQRRFTKGSLFQINYTWSHGIADASIGSGGSVAFQNMSCRACDRSSTNIDVRHVMTMNAAYQLPFGKGKQFLSGSGALSQLVGGWEPAGISSARTGLPVNITVSRTAAALLDGNNSGQRPNLAPGVPIYAAGQTITNWFNPAAFSAPANGTKPDYVRRREPC